MIQSHSLRAAADASLNAHISDSIHAQTPAHSIRFIVEYTLFFCQGETGVFLIFCLKNPNFTLTFYESLLFIYYTPAVQKLPPLCPILVYHYKRLLCFIHFSASGFHYSFHNDRRFELKNEGQPRAHFLLFQTSNLLAKHLLFVYNKEAKQREFKEVPSDGADPDNNQGRS
ncbi:MAG: hypothetical protein IKD72_09780 [Clostridia bacterium]|nr:hypothetical protein [Clostridia bacterium]